MERIEADRETLLSGGSLPTPGELLTLSLNLGPGELDGEGLPASHIGGPGGPGPGPESGPPDRRQAGEPERTVHLTLRSDLAPASLDTFLEIFRDRAHALLPGFRGEGGGTVVDLGGNEGFYTLRMKLLNPELRVVAAEPVRENAELFRTNLEANGVAGVTLRETAITSWNGTVQIETLPHVGTVASTDMLAFPRPWIHADQICRRTVPAMTLEALLEAAEVGEAEILKMDVEGGEVDILFESRKALRRFRRIVVECHGNDARRGTAEIMEAKGFRCIHAEQKLSGDLYFLRG